jgi:hypothetical protein
MKDTGISLSDIEIIAETSEQSVIKTKPLYEFASARDGTHLKNKEIPAYGRSRHSDTVLLGQNGL